MGSVIGHEIGRRLPESLGDFLDSFESRGVAAFFDVAQVWLVNPQAICELLLANAKLLPPLPHAVAEGPLKF